MPADPLSPSNVALYIFSFNRGQFLDNCLQSVLRCAGNLSATVIDDQSDDPKTQETLDYYGRDLRILTAGTDNNPEHKTGGLYNNMAFAFTDARTRGFSYVLFLQDDMQLVRPIRQTDLDAATAFFDANSNAAELHTCFMKRFYAQRDESLMTVDASGEAYLRPSDYPGFSGFSAVGLFSIERFFTLFGELRRGEYANNAFAQSHGIQMGVSARPFMMWLPFPISHRGKERNIPLKMVETLGGCGFFPYDIMDEQSVDALITRDKTDRKPYAEDWLSSPALGNVPIWSFAGGLSNLLARGGYRALIGRILTKLRS